MTITNSNLPLNRANDQIRIFHKTLDNQQYRTVALGMSES
jgi:hypothetical protein